MKQLPSLKKFRAAPFWSLNGKLDKAELARQIAVIEEMGFSGAFIHSRVGLATEYMSDEWLELVEFCSEELAKRGLDAWLYDEDRWPSGTCGGYVTRNPRFRMKFVSMKLLAPSEFSMGSYGQTFLGAFAVKLTGEPYTRQAVEGLDPRAGMRLADAFRIWDASEVPEGYIAAVFEVEEMALSNFYNGYTYADTLNAEATEDFIRRTHEVYLQRFGDKFGKEIVGIFTDEPHRGALLSGFGLANGNRLALLPYTYDLFPTYQKRWGEDLSEKLPYLYFRREGDGFSETIWRYVETVQQMFLDNFAKPYRDFCKKHNLLVTGHVLHEDNLACQTTMSGSVMRYYEHMDVPGMDNLAQNNSCIPAAIQVSSVARQLGKDAVLSELDGCTGWQMTFEQYKQIGDWHAAFGINFRCPHLSWYTMKGEAKRDYPASILHQSGWYSEYGAVEDYFARLGTALAENKSLARTLVVSPIESAWGLSAYGNYEGFSSRDPRYQKLEREYWDTMVSLVSAGIPFDYGDEEMMSRLSRVEISAGAAVLKFGEAEYSEVVLSGMITVRESTVALLEEFLKAGGRVTVCGMPDHVEGKTADPSERLAGCQISEISELGTRLKETCAFPFSIEERENAGSFYEKTDFVAVPRKTEDGTLLFVFNYDRKSGHPALIRVKGDVKAEKWNLRTGEVEGIPFVSDGEETAVRYDFAVSEEALLHFTKGSVPKAAGRPELSRTLAPDVPMSYALNEENALVLDVARFSVDGEDCGTEDILKIDRRLRDRFGLKYRGGEMIQPWYQEKFFGDSYAKPLCKLCLEFEFEADTIPEQLTLMAESPEDFVFALNGKQVSLEGKTGAKLDVCFSRIPLDPALVRKGRNVLSASCEFREGIGLEALYLFGTFGVRAGNPCRIVSLAKSLRFGDISEQGFPFYSGSVTYQIPAEPGEYGIEVSDFSAACLKSGNKISAFAPYALEGIQSGGMIELTAVLTRKNLFGPLHQIPKNPEATGPDSFMTGGGDYSAEYQLIGQGIFAPPVLVRRK